VGVLDAALAGVIAGILAATLGAGPAPSIAIGAVMTAASIGLLAHMSRRFIDHRRRSLDSRFGRPIDVG
jgi:Kef-type K+ transport system membrane component KefB